MHSHTFMLEREADKRKAAKRYLMVTLELIISREKPDVCLEFEYHTRH